MAEPWETFVDGLREVVHLPPTGPAPLPDKLFRLAALDASDRYLGWIDARGALRVCDLREGRHVHEDPASREESLSRTLFALDGGFATWEDGSRKVTVIRADRPPVEAVLPEELGGAVTSLSPSGDRIATAAWKTAQRSVIATFPSLEIVCDLPDSTSRVDFAARLTMTEATGRLSLTSLEGQPAFEIESPHLGASSGWLSPLAPGVWCIHGHAGMIVISLGHKKAFRVFEVPVRGPIACPSLSSDRRGLRLVVFGKAYRCEIDLARGKPVKTPAGLRSQVAGGTEEALFHPELDLWSYERGPDVREALGPPVLTLHERLPPRLCKEGGLFVNDEGALVQKVVAEGPRPATPVAWARDGKTLVSLDVEGAVGVWRTPTPETNRLTTA